METKLPIHFWRRAILDAVAPAPVTIITAETGAGKSTQVPLMLYQAGYRVVVTQPRRLAARSLAEYVARVSGSELGNEVGYHTSDERCAKRNTPVLFCTDGLHLVRELVGYGIEGRDTILVLDEVHEWNLNVEVLLAWTKRRLLNGEDFKILLMSATIDTERLVEYIGGNPPVVHVPGRLHPIERRKARPEDLVPETVRFVRKGENVLVFQSGKADIARTMKDLEHKLGSSAYIYPLHGELSPEEQQMCFFPAPEGKAKVIVATNVAQTSITIPDITAVVDDGMERRAEVADGIQGLYLKPVSQADIAQRAGRAGRVRPGTYVLCSDTPDEKRRAFPVPEILRLRLDQMVLRLAVQGVDAADLHFFHAPNHGDIVEARRSLVALGAMTAQGNVTETGRRMAQLPISVRFARMLVEAEVLGVVSQVAVIAACLEAGDIRSRPQKNGKTLGQPIWRKLTKESGSDLIALYDVWKFGHPLLQTGKHMDDMFMRAGIFLRNFRKAGELREKILYAIERHVEIREKKFRSQQSEREAVLQACLVGFVDHVFHLEEGGYRGSDPHLRRMDGNTVLQGKPEWIVGIPRDLERTVGESSQVDRLVALMTVVTRSQLEKIAPDFKTRWPETIPFNGIRFQK